jgi:hypothetical protein
MAEMEFSGRFTYRRPFPHQDRTTWNFGQKRQISMDADQGIGTGIRFFGNPEN